MPAVHLTDEDVANVLTYIYSQWGNGGAVVTPAQVRAARAAGPRTPAGGGPAH
jgi:nitrite reductase (NO-forming)